MVAIVSQPAKDGFKLSGKVFYECIDFNLNLTLDFTYMCLEDPKTARTQFCFFDFQMDGFISQSNVSLVAHSKAN